MVGFLPIDRMRERLQRAKDDSDVAFFSDLLLFGEMVIKLIVAGTVAVVEGTRSSQPGAWAGRLVRADGLGEWAAVLRDLVNGSGADMWPDELSADRDSLSTNAPLDAWPSAAASDLEACLATVGVEPYRRSARHCALDCCDLFVQLRNKTRGHGAPDARVLTASCPELEPAIDALVDNVQILKYEWAYLHQNLSGKYRVTRLTPTDRHFAALKTSQAIGGPVLLAGVYVQVDAGSPLPVHLLRSDLDATDFFLPNGGYKNNHFEALSYITGNRQQVDATAFARPPDDSLPRSHTHGDQELCYQGNVLGNLPPVSETYVPRPALEDELLDLLLQDRYPSITMIGRGGIGKTWLALKVLHHVTTLDEFEAVVWLSSRDIDLMPSGPKPVAPAVKSQDEIAKEVVRLMQPAERGSATFDPREYTQELLRGKTSWGPVLLVFDNFETLREPADTFQWLDANVRHPNKILLTTRQRGFRGDFPLEVRGMERSEYDELLNVTAATLGVTDLVTPEYATELYDKCGGHPYVVRLVLGEVARTRKRRDALRVVANREDILDALFDRTYRSLSTAACRVFLTLCSWRSIVPEIAIEAVLMRSIKEHLDFERAVDELLRSSFVETVHADEEEDYRFLVVPLVAFEFGQGKLKTSPDAAAIEADRRVLEGFGAAQRGDVRHGVAPRIRQLFRDLATRITREKADIEAYRPMLEFVARRYPPAWLLLARLCEEVDPASGLTHADSAIRQFLQETRSTEEEVSAWRELARIRGQRDDVGGEAQAWSAIAQVDGVAFAEISLAANQLNNLFRRTLVIDSVEKRILVEAVAEVMQRRKDEANADDLSRLAWLWLHLQEVERAKEVTIAGLRLEPENEYCRNLAVRLEI